MYPRVCRKYTRWMLLTALATAMTLCGGIPQAFAVGPTGKIVGTVTDNTGALLPGVTVLVTNEGTNESRTAVTESSGDFIFPVLPVGNYTVKGTKDGFQTFEQKHVVLQVDQSVTVPVSLQVGSVQQVVEVTGTTAELNLTDATISHVVDEQRIVDLPLNGRDTLQLQYIMPGVSYDNDNVAHGQGQHEGVVVNGNRPGSNYYLLDGVDMTDSYLSVAPTFPAPDALQEFDIQTSNFTAQYGRSSGGIVNAATKAGTNQWHGDAFEFLRNDVFNAHNFFDVPGAKKPSFKLNQFGGTIGGPIQKNKTFVFGYYQGARQRKDTTTTTGTVLTDQERPDVNGTGNANFSDCSTVGVKCPVDPRTVTAANPQGTPFPNNTIPADRIDPTAVNFIKNLLPRQNSTSNGVPTNIFAAPSAPNLDDNNENQFLVRVDHTFGTADSAFARYFFNQDRATGIGFDNFPNAPHYKNFRNQNVAIDYTHTFSSNLLNTGVFGFTRLAHTRGPSANLGWSSFGGPASQGTKGFTEIYGSVSGSINGGGDGTFTQNRQTWQFTDYVSWVKGKQTLALGGDYRKESVNRVEDYFTDPQFNFNGSFSGNSLSDLLLGLPNSYDLQTEVVSQLRHPAADLYVADNYKAKPNLSIDAGLRWEPFLPAVDQYNDQLCFDPTFTAKSTYYPTAPPGILFPGPPVGSGSLGKGDAGCPRKLIPTRWTNFAPRIGVNWDPTNSGKMSISASYGLFWDQSRLIAYNRFSTAQPFDANSAVNNPGNLANNYAPSLTGDSVYTNTGLVNPYPFVIPRAPAARAAFSPSFGGNWPTYSTEDVLAPNYNNGYTHEWNLTIQREFFKDTTVSASYIGNHGQNLYISREYNYALASSYVNYPGLTPQQNLSQNQSNLGAPNGTRRRLSNITCGGIPCYGNFEEEDPGAWSNFNAAELVVNRRMKDGLTFLASYVYASYLDIISYGAEGGTGPRDPENFALNYGPSDMNVRHRFAASYIWQIPKVQRFNAVESGILNGWSIQGISTIQTGAPYSINSNQDTAARAIGNDTADLVPGQTPSIPNRSRHEYFNTAAFLNAAPNTFGDTGRNFLTGPSLVNFDTSFFKEFPISERWGRVQFRSEFFNTFNHPNFYNPDNTVGDGTFGQLTSARDPRFVQFALKYLF
jgi:Carboxypeptidase regulatory-like domain/TonB-dependent Receptor Plug Domain